MTTFTFDIANLTAAELAQLDRNVRSPQAKGIVEADPMRAARAIAEVEAVQAARARTPLKLAA